MSGKVSGWVWDQELPINEKYVLLAYADHADHAGNNIFPSVELMMQKTGYSERTVQRLTRRLERKGYLIKKSSGLGGRSKTTQYSIPIKGATHVTLSRG